MSHSTLNGVPLIPLETLLGNPEISNPVLSPTGKHIAYIKPINDVQNIWVRTVGQQDDHNVTSDTGRGIYSCFWAYSGSKIIYFQDKGGDENFKLFSVDVETSQVVELAPGDNGADWPIQVWPLKLSADKPDELIILMNARDESIQDLYRVKMTTGELSLLTQCEKEWTDSLIDHDLRFRGYIASNPDGSSTLFFRDGDGDQFAGIKTWGFEDSNLKAIYGFTPDNQGLYFGDAEGFNTRALIEWYPLKNKREILYSEESNDVSRIMMHPTSHKVQAVMINRQRMDVVALDQSLEADFERIRANSDGDFSVVNRTLDDKKWLVGYNHDDGPLHYYIYDRDSYQFEFQFVHHQDLLKLPLVKMKPIKFTARDGLTIHGYLTLPTNTNSPVPMVLNVHGGPWSRDSWGFRSEAQWLANRGYACLQVNYRGSTGYGKKHLNAGNREWGRNMQHDLSDAVRWAIDEGIADADKIVIYGGSYGGYAALCGVTFTPELYCAGISAVGVSNLETFLQTIPPYWERYRLEFDHQVAKLPRYETGEKAGLPKDEADFTDEERAEIEFMRSRSPLFFVDNVQVPMLIAQGANDPRVKKTESDQFVNAMREKGLEVEYLVYADEGHGFARLENRMDYYYRMDSFLSKILGGRSEK